MANRWKKNKKPDPANQAAEKFDVGKATIYGDLMVKGSLKNVKNYENVQGNKVTNFSLNTPTNLVPTWTSGVANIANLDGKIRKGSKRPTRSQKSRPRGRPRGPI